MVTEQEDKIAEEENIQEALSLCGHPEWSVRKVKRDKATPKPVATGKANNEQEKSKGPVVLCGGPFRKSVASFKETRFFDVSQTHYQEHVSSYKDNLPPPQKADAVYEIPCGDCQKIGSLVWHSLKGIPKGGGEI